MKRHTLTFLSSLTLLSSTAFTAEVIKLHNGNSFSGNITNSDTSSILKLEHPFSKDLMQIKERSIKEIKFQNERKNSTHSEIIQLINGDNFPCEVTKIDQEKVSFNSTLLGSHSINRNQIGKITFNNKSKKSIYHGPGDDLSAWTTSSEDWNLKKGTLSVAKRSNISIQIPNLSENYILQFTSKRDTRSPQFRFCFSVNNSTADRKSDHYYIDFNSRGIALQRAKNGIYHPLAKTFNNDLFDQQEINVTLHVDRKNQKLALYLNDKLIEAITETKTKLAPEGNFLVIKNLQSTGFLTQISDINIYSWDGKINEASNDSTKSLKKHDLITDFNGSIIPSNILNLSKDSAELTFKTTFAKNDSKLPKSSINVLEFKHSDKELELPKTHFIMNLSNGAKLHYTSSQFIDSKLKLNHPILGDISIPKNSISLLRALAQETETSDKN